LEGIKKGKERNPTNLIGREALIMDPLIGKEVNKTRSKMPRENLHDTLDHMESL